MSEPRRPEIRGACPGALRPMESGDGLIVRVRPHAASLPIPALRRIAEAAARFGNGAIDVTRRANLQLRGISPNTLPAVQSVLEREGLLDASPGAESIRNIIASPSAGLDPSELIDVRPIARELEARLAGNEALWRLPPKFGFLIDGGGETSLDGELVDIRAKAVRSDAVAVGLDARGGVLWLGEAARDAAAEVMARVALAFLATQAQGSRKRIRDLDEATLLQIRRDVALAPLADAPGCALRTQHFGVLASPSRQPYAVAIGAPFGRLDADLVQSLSDLAGAQGATEMRVAPWRALLIPVATADAAEALLAAADRLGLVTSDADPLSLIDACPGAPACPCAARDTREAARKVAALFTRLGIKSAHVSGCPKGCARTAPADLVLVAGKEGYGVVLNGRADAPANRVVDEALDDLVEAAHG